MFNHRNILCGHPFLLETDGGTSAKVSRWYLTLQNLLYTMAHVHREENELADTLSRAPIALSSPEWEAPRMSDLNPFLSASSYRFGSMRVVAEVVERRDIFDSCCGPIA